MQFTFKLAHLTKPDKPIKFAPDFYIQRDVRFQDGDNEERKLLRYKNICLYHDRENKKIWLTSVIEEYEESIHVIRLDYKYASCKKTKEGHVEIHYENALTAY